MTFPSLVAAMQIEMFEQSEMDAPGAMVRAERKAAVEAVLRERAPYVAAEHGGDPIGEPLLEEVYWFLRRGYDCDSGYRHFINTFAELYLMSARPTDASVQ